MNVRPQVSQVVDLTDINDNNKNVINSNTNTVTNNNNLTTLNGISNDNKNFFKEKIEYYKSNPELFNKLNKQQKFQLESCK